MKRLVSLVLAVLFFSGSALGAGKVGEKAPIIRVKKKVTSNFPSTETYRGKVTIVEFWATWCGACVKNIPHLNDLDSKYSPLGVDFIALSSDRSESQLIDCINSKGIKYNVALDGGSVDDFAVMAYPTMFVVDSDGVIVWRGYPWSVGLEKALDEALIKRGPDSVISGVDLGEFKNLESSLRGGSDFANAYRQLEIERDNVKSAKRGLASRILAAINNKIKSKINFAKSIEKNDPARAKEMFSEVANNYGGVEVSNQAVYELEELKKDKK